MSKTISIDEFLVQDGQAIDVRSPKEFAHSHIPGAVNVPLFSDAERALVGTTYKKVGTKEAVTLGVELVGPKLSSLFNQIQQFSGLKKIYCWRGGMRSGFLSSFLQSLQVPAVQLQGGYKAFRRKMLATLAVPRHLQLLGGMTGSGKTELLGLWKKQGQSVLDLEAIAKHRGSAFGELANQAQPSTEQFENEIALYLYHRDKEEVIWVEDESRLIGLCAIPNLFYETMQNAPLYLLECSVEERIERIYRLYGQFPVDWWKANTLKVQKRLGGQRTKEVLSALDEGKYRDAIALLLTYYDEGYSYALKKHKGLIIPFVDK